MRSVAVPFFKTRSNDVISSGSITSTRDTAHGLVRLDGEHLFVQWRMQRTVDLVGAEIRSDKTVDPVREAVIPISHLSSAAVRTTWWRWRNRTALVLIAADLRAFESLVGDGGLELSHPAELRVGISSKDLDAAREFASELELALADASLRGAEGEDRRIAGGSREPEPLD